MRDDPRVVALVTSASGGDQGAWHELVDRYAPLVYTICVRYRLSNHDIEDVGQNVWLLLVEQLGKLREPAALPGWLATTTARECLRVVTAAHKTERLSTGLDDSVLFVDDAVIDEEILMAERNAALRAAFAELPPRCQQLLSMLLSDPPHSPRAKQNVSVPRPSFRPRGRRDAPAQSAIGSGRYRAQRHRANRSRKTPQARRARRSRRRQSAP